MHKVFKVSAVLLVCEANLALKVSVVHKGRKENAVFKVNEVYEEKLARKVRKVSVVRQVLAVPVLMVRTDCVALKESPETFPLPLHKPKRKRGRSCKKSLRSFGKRCLH